MIVRLYAIKPDHQVIAIRRTPATRHPHVKETRKMQGYSAAITSFFLFISVGTALAEQNANQDDPPTAWPLGRQHLLAGHYVGKLHPDNTQCQAVRAELWLEAKANKKSRRYILKTACIAPEAQHSTTTTTERGPWWLDKNGDDCLTLSRDDVSDLSLNPNMYGFGINEETDSKGQEARFSLGTVNTSGAHQQ
ncbi:hypothetical protein EBA01_08185 [Xanthomonas oryzae pv. oryzae]|nr:hypothetical protein BVV16_08365 [Xanthomonas oryzae pv. oryzae]AUI96087.1 hypothetical protein BVV17_08375 [Xanthomonas oryzae pv. oryzae]AUI99760.1 hypothetical protein BVV18_08380 [Xanthomonas oryzae pv. oryzae]AUJ03438.1 hypothetical protein BVV10_08385 [Xanthomonas oryzae pv. oryzae]AUJ07103.1 hypothetical protein BVV19_08390 [Xanthomonas oryzae pv. oryzae]